MSYYAEEQAMAVNPEGGAVGELDATISALEDAVSILQNRIAPVLRSDMVEEEGKVPRSVPSSDLRKRIQMLQDVRSRIISLSERVDL